MKMGIIPVFLEEDDYQEVTGGYSQVITIGGCVRRESTGAPKTKTRPEARAREPSQMECLKPLEKGNQPPAICAKRFHGRKNLRANTVGRVY
jgi:hypothetical protein